MGSRGSSLSLAVPGGAVRSWATNTASGVTRHRHPRYPVSAARATLTAANRTTDLTMVVSHPKTGSNIDHCTPGGNCGLNLILLILFVSKIC